MKKVIFQINEETAEKRLVYGNLLFIIGFVIVYLMKSEFEFIGICVLYAATLITTQALWFGKYPKLPKWVPYCLLFLSAVFSVSFIVMIVGFVFFWDSPLRHLKNN